MDTELKISVGGGRSCSADATRSDSKIDAEGPEDFEFVSEKEAALLTLATVLGGGDQGATQDMVALALDWAEQVRIHAAMLAVVLSGEATIGFAAPGEIELKRVDDQNVKQQLRAHVIALATSRRKGDT
jgi:hypothetical protein